MFGFIEELWKSVFTPGTSPTLIIATHTTFALLVVTLLIFVFLSRSIHLINLLVLSLLLWATLTWFIGEINAQNEALKTNEALAKEGEKSTKTKTKTTAASTSSSSSTKDKTPTPTTRRSRKI